jgi:RNA 2',3'-cyclic 3'-phosphodiesterase
MTRAFVAVVPPAVVLDAVADRVGSIPVPGGRPTARAQWHLTVQFLGNDADVDAVTSEFATVPLDLGTGSVGLGGAFVFGNARRARILAFGLAAGAQWMQTLAQQVGARLAPLGYARDADEELRPHLTIARFRAPTDLRQLRAQAGPEPVGPPWTVAEVVLFESILGAGGARHVVRARVPVGQAGHDQEMAEDPRVNGH